MNERLLAREVERARNPKYRSVIEGMVEFEEAKRADQANIKVSTANP